LVAIGFLLDVQLLVASWFSFAIRLLNKKINHGLCASTSINGV
jgi:hypothetical protein